MKYQGTGFERLIYLACVLGLAACVLGLAACVLVLPRCASATLAAGLTRGPYLQRLTSNSVTVVWNTDVAAECAVQINPLGSQPTVVGGLTYTVCVVSIGDLAPGTVYAYTPLADGVPLVAASGFRTPHVALPYTFLVLGDSGSGNQDQLAVRDSMLNSPADFIVHTGDMIYPEAAPGQWNPKYFTPYKDLLSELVLWPSLGNHDVRGDDGVSWRDVFHTPANNAAGREDYYSFDYGNSHVVVLDSNRNLDPGSAQHAFLDQDLAASTATWKFVAFHHTIYSSGHHGSDLTLQQYLVPIFDAHGVDVVFMGHDHNYERTKPLFGDQVVAPEQGTLYVTTGGGGGELRPVASSAFTAYSESVFHFVRVSVAGEDLLLEMVRADGSIGDSVVLAKEVAAECGDGQVNQVGEVCDGSDDVACPGQCDAGCQCPPVCGDGRQDPATEECDWPADSACPGLCIADCTCADPPPVLDLDPIGDTYIEAGSEATWDHGASTRVDIDGQPRAIAYLKFDLSGVAFPIESAMLMLHCTNDSDDGGTFYPVSDWSWIEGTGNGVDGSSAQGPGLKWIDIDTDGDGDVDGVDTSPYVPVLTEPLASLGGVTSGDFYQIDVTSALETGPGVYSFAVVNDSSNGTMYSSRDNPAVTERPVLRVRLPLECHADVDCADGVFCNGGEICVRGRCGPGSPVECDDGEACTVDQCDESAASCRFDLVTDGTACDDANLCTQTDACKAGACVGANPGTCTAADQCHDVGTCDPATGQCSSLAKADGSSCDDGNSCTQSDTCIVGVCAGANPVICNARNQCRDEGICDPATGQCSSLAKADGSPCDDADACSKNDVCFAGECMGEPLPDSDADGFCDAIDLCPKIPNPAQTDADNDGVGDLCQCTAPAPGRCIGGGGSKRSDCLLEVMSSAPVSLNRRGTKVKSVIRCSDGDAQCDLDGARDGQCTFGVSFCFGNADPRYPRCTPSEIRSMEILRPRAPRSTAAAEIEQALGILGLEVRRRGRVIADSFARVGNSQCSPLLRLVTPAPKAKRKKASLKKFQLRATAINGRRDKDQFTLACE